MYHHQGKSIHPSSRAPIPPERLLSLQGGNGAGDSGLVLSTDAKPRLKWSPELHEKFIQAVDQLGGADKATPKTVLKLMGIPGLTLYHLKSHLQKYRLSKNLHRHTSSGSNKHAVAGNRMAEANGTRMSDPGIGLQENKSLHISEAIQMQIEVQRRLHEQIEVQRHLQLRIEAQGKYLQAVLEKAQETLGRQNLGTVGLDTSEIQLCEMVSKVSTQCLNSNFSELKELSGLCQQQTSQPTDWSFDSCLTSCEGSQKYRDIHNNGRGLANFKANAPMEKTEVDKEPTLRQTEFRWCEDLKENRNFLSSMSRNSERKFPVEMNSDDLTIGVGLQGGKGNNHSSYSDRGSRGRYDDFRFIDQTTNETGFVQPEDDKISQGYRLPHFTPTLDLNACDENDAASNCKKLDLNGFSWS